MKEVWKPINKYEGLYEVSNLGRVRSLDRFDSVGRKHTGKILKQAKCGRGYLFVGLYKDGKRENSLVHKLVANAFIGESPKGFQINHIDENKENNHAENLEYVTPIENTRYGGAIDRMAKAHNKPVIATVLTTGEIEKYESISIAGKSLGRDRSNIGHALNGRMKTAYGRRWTFDTNAVEWEAGHEA